MKRTPVPLDTPRGRFRVVVRLFAPAALAACTFDGGSPRYTVRDSAGVTIVETRTGTWGDGDGWTVAPRPNLRIGVVDGDPRYQFDRVLLAARATDGRIVVADGGSQEIRVFDPDGGHLVSMGGEGDGPGEFRSMNDAVLIGDTIGVFDGALGRVSHFDLSGALLGSIRIQPTGDPIHPLRLYRLGGAAGDRLVLVVQAYPADMRPEPVTYWDSIPTLLYGADGTLRDTVGEFAGMDTHSTPERAGSVAFARFSSSFVQGGLLYMTDGGRYEVRVYDLDTGLTRILRVLKEPRPVTPAVFEDYIRRALEGARDGALRRDVRESIERWPHAETLPWIADLVVDDAGRVWAREYKDRFDRSLPRWGVFDEDGGWLGVVEVPEGFTPHQIDGRQLIGVRRDGLGVEYVELYEIDADR